MDAITDRREHELQRSRHAVSLRLLPEQYRALAADAARYGISLAAAATIRMFKEDR